MSDGWNCTRQGEMHVISLVFCSFVWLACLPCGCRFGKKLMHVLDKSGKSWYTKNIPCGRGETGRHDRFRLRYYIEK